MPNEVRDVVILPGGRQVTVPVLPDNQTATWEHILMAVAEPGEGEKTAEEK